MRGFDPRRLHVRLAAHTSRTLARAVVAGAATACSVSRAFDYGQALVASPLRRNRDFMLLQTAGLLSSGGSQITAIAYPLLVLALTGSPAKAGIVAFARLLGMAVFSLPAGLAAHAVRAVAVGSLGLLIAFDEIVFWMIPIVAFVEGSGAPVYSVAHAGAIRAVVPTHQLPDASAIVTGREAAIGLASPAIGGALFGLSRALPFLVHAVSYAFASIALLAMCTPFQEKRDADRAPLRSRIGEGFRFLWDQPFLRTCAFLFGLTNFIGPGVPRRSALACFWVRSCRALRDVCSRFGRCSCSSSGRGSAVGSLLCGPTSTSS